jgi:hypothetical protein
MGGLVFLVSGYTYIMAKPVHTPCFMNNSFRLTSRSVDPLLITTVAAILDIFPTFQKVAR